MKKEELLNLVDTIKHTKATGDIISVASDEMTVQFKSGRLNSIFNKSLEAVSVRVIAKGKIGASFGTDLTKTGELPKNAVYNAQYGPVAMFDFPETCVCDPVKTYDCNIDALEIDQAVDIGNKAISMLNRAVPEMKYDVSINKRKLTFSLANTSGFYGSYIKTKISHGIAGRICRHKDILTISDNRSSGSLSLSLEEAVERVIYLYGYAKATAISSSKAMPVIFTTDVMPVLLRCLIHALNGNTVLLGLSPLMDKIGEQVIDKRFRVNDVPNIDYGISSRPFDDEGIVSYPLTLIDNGVLINYTYDLQTAGQAGVKSNGRANREIHALPTPGTSNVLINGGNATLADMIKSVKQGIIIYDVIGAPQNNISTGDFSVNIGLGYKIENGSIIGRIKNCMVSGNIFDLLKNKVLAIGKDIKERGGYFIPDVLFKDVTVHAK